MSHEEAKLKRSKRRSKTIAAAKRQQKMARRLESNIYAPKMELGRFMKRHAYDCGKPRCALCGNPRRLRGEKTIQEIKMEQLLDIE